MRREELEGWLRLLAAPALTAQAGRLALAKLGLPDRILESSWLGLSRLVGQQAAGQILAPDEDSREAVSRSLDWLGSVPQARLLTLADPAYPRRLLAADNPPLALFVRGDAARLAARPVCIMGGPGCPSEGLRLAAIFASSIERAGFAVATGFGNDIEMAAASAARGGIAVFAGGPDRVRQEDRAVAVDVASHGLIVSAAMPGTAGSRGAAAHLGVLAGISEAFVAIAAPAISPAAQLARLAADMNRDIFAVPGSVESGMWKGCHRLIRDGARLVETPADVLQALGNLSSVG